MSGPDRWGSHPEKGNVAGETDVETVHHASAKGTKATTHVHVKSHCA